MKDIQTVTEWKEMIEPALDVKVEEFHLMGYDQATSEDIWNCLLKKIWNGNPKKRIYEVIADIFHLKTNVYLSYLTVEAHTSEDLVASIAAVTGAQHSEKNQEN